VGVVEKGEEGNESTDTLTTPFICDFALVAIVEKVVACKLSRRKRG
jgi:hypothetical protein